MPRRTLGDKPMTNAERQARYRARVAARPVIHYRRAADRRSRTQRWRDAVAELVALQAESTRSGSRHYPTLAQHCHRRAIMSERPGDFVGIRIQASSSASG